MRAGELRHRVTIQQMQDTQNEYGEPVKEWVDVVTVWASIEGLRGREYFEAQQTMAQADHRIKIRYMDGIKPTMRIVYGTRIFSIQSVLDPDGRRRELHLICKEQVS